MMNRSVDEIKEGKSKIVLIPGGWRKKDKSIVGIFLKLLKIILPFSRDVTCVSANHSVKIHDPRVHFIKIEYKCTEKSFLKSTFYFLLYQIKVVLIMMKLIKSKKVDIFIFCFGADLFVLPIVLARFFGKKVIIRSDGRLSIFRKCYRRDKDKILFRILLFRVIEEITYSLATRIVPESEFMVHLYDFQKYRRKLCTGPLYVEDIFKKNKKLDERKYHVGYIGRFSTVKGVLEFTRSLPLLQKDNININILFVGDGDLRDKVEEVIYDHNIQATFVGWIKKEKMPVYLNNIKLLILPSHLEGLPNVVLEAMACGTPVLATSVGAVPDVIKDGETGFIMENNSPECIAENVKRVLNYPCLNEIVKNAKELMEKEYTYEAAVERYRKILENV